ncbi:hypothetical protein RYX36_005659 [Vicia faba]
MERTAGVQKPADREKVRELTEGKAEAGFGGSRVDRWLIRWRICVETVSEEVIWRDQRVTGDDDERE